MSSSENAEAKRATAVARRQAAERKWKLSQEKSEEVKAWLSLPESLPLTRTALSPERAAAAMEEARHFSDDAFSVIAKGTNKFATKLRGFRKRQSQGPDDEQQQQQQRSGSREAAKRRERLHRQRTFDMLKAEVVKELYVEQPYQHERQPSCMPLPSPDPPPRLSVVVVARGGRRPWSSRSLAPYPHPCSRSQVRDDRRAREGRHQRGRV